MVSLSQSFTEWANKALDLGFGSFSEGDDEPFVLIVEASGQMHEHFEEGDIMLVLGKEERLERFERAG